MSDIVSHLTQDTFTGAVQQGLAVVDFGAGWGGPCLAARSSAVTPEGVAA